MIVQSDARARSAGRAEAASAAEGTSTACATSGSGTRARGRPLAKTTVDPDRRPDIDIDHPMLPRLIGSRASTGGSRAPAGASAASPRAGPREPGSPPRAPRSSSRAWRRGRRRRRSRGGCRGRGSLPCLNSTSTTATQERVRLGAPLAREPRHSRRSQGVAQPSPTHTSSPVHAVQTTPPTPHCAFVPPVSHVVPSQQPAQFSGPQ